MKIDFLSCTKMLYFAEKLLQDSIHELPGISDSFAKQFDMNVDEVREICDQFENGKLLFWGEATIESEDPYGKMTGEFSYDALFVDTKKVTKHIEYLKDRYRLRQRPFVSRKAVASIAKQIEAAFSEDEFMRVVTSFSQSGWQLRNKTYTLTDLLFRHAYASAWVQPLPKILAEFLNPIYFTIETSGLAQKLFEYIDRILSTNAEKDDYELWLQETRNRHSLRSGPIKDSNQNSEIPDNFVITLNDREIRVNNFLISKPYSTGKNMAFFEYFEQNPNKQISREEMPNYVKNSVPSKGFSKVLNDLGFKGEILKAFFSKRSKSSATFRNNISSAKLTDEGINLDILMQELRLADSKNSPK